MDHVIFTVDFGHFLLIDFQVRYRLAGEVYAQVLARGALDVVNVGHHISVVADAFYEHKANVVVDVPNALGPTLCIHTHNWMLLVHPLINGLDPISFGNACAVFYFYK